MQRATRREWLGLGVIALPCLLYAMDLTVLNLTLPRLSAELRPSSSQLLWIVDIYGFLVAGLLVTMGTLGDRIGRRRLLLAGGAMFGVASVLAAFSTSATMLISARALLGVAGATLAPSTLSLIRTMFADPRERTVALGVWGTSYAVGGAIGPVIGGLMLDHFWWGSVFLLAVPVMVLLLALGPFTLPADRATTAGRIDLASAALSLVAVLAVVFGLKTWARAGIGALPLSAIALGLGVGWTFVRRQRGLAEPLLDLRLFRVPAFAVSLAVFLVTTLLMMGSYIFIGQYLQLVLGLSPFSAGLALLPGSCAVIAGSLLSPVITRRVKPIRVIGTGVSLAAVGFAIIAQVPALGLPAMITGAIVLHLGVGPVFMLGTELVISAAPPERAGAAASISETCLELGGALGIALLGSLGTAIYRSGMPAAAGDARDTLGSAVELASHLPARAGAELLETGRTAFAHAFQVTTWTCAVIAAATAMTAVIVMRGRRPAQPVVDSRMLAAGGIS